MLYTAYCGGEQRDCYLKEKFHMLCINCCLYLIYCLFMYPSITLLVCISDMGSCQFWDTLQIIPDTRCKKKKKKLKKDFNRKDDFSTVGHVPVHITLLVSVWCRKSYGIVTLYGFLQLFN